MIRPLTLAAALTALIACDPPGVGEACDATGEGFTRKDPCANTCVEWEVQCPGGALVTPGVCSGPTCSEAAPCGDGFVCVPIDMTDSACLPADLCEADALGDAALPAPEREDGAAGW